MSASISGLCTRGDGCLPRTDANSFSAMQSCTIDEREEAVKLHFQGSCVRLESSYVLKNRLGLRTSYRDGLNMTRYMDFTEMTRIEQTSIVRGASTNHSRTTIFARVGFHMVILIKPKGCLEHHIFFLFPWKVGGSPSVVDVTPALLRVHGMGPICSEVLSFHPVQRRPNMK